MALPLSKSWNFTQFAETSPDERLAIHDALMRSREPDTLPKAMRLTSLFDLPGKPLQLVEAN